MDRNTAFQRARAYRDSGVPAIARATPHPDGWPAVAGDWEVAIRADNGMYVSENNTTVADQHTVME